MANEIPAYTGQHLRRALREHSIERWFPRCHDPLRGGFHQRFSREWQLLGDGPRSLVFQSRMVWAAATVARRQPSWRHDLVAMMDHGMGYLESTFWDRPAGGLMFRENCQDDKHSYGIAFGLYAAAAACRQSGSPDVRAFAMRIFDWWDRCAHDDAGGGYHELLDREGRPVNTAPAHRSGTTRDQIGTPYGCRSSNTLLHVIEALTELYQATMDERAGARLGECLVLLERLVVRDANRLCKTYDERWRPVDRGSSYGHDVEACFLALAARKAMGWELDTPLLRLADVAVRRGHDRVIGGLYSGNRKRFFRLVRAKIWWVQAEFLNYLAVRLTLLDEDSIQLRSLLRETCAFVLERQIDGLHGGWLDIVSRDGSRVIRADKGHEWKAIYHEVRALLNAADTLDALEATDDGVARHPPSL